jgi:hypothetical protein
VISKILIAFILVAATVSVQAVGLAALLKALVKWHAHLPTRFWPVTWLLIRVTWALIFIHVTEIAVWALFFLFFRCYLRHDRLRGFNTAKRMATVRTGGGIDWHSDVRDLDGIFLRRGEQNVEGTHGNPPKLIR